MDRGHTQAVALADLPIRQPQTTQPQHFSGFVLWCSHASGRHPITFIKHRGSTMWRGFYTVDRVRWSPLGEDDCDGA